MRTGILIGLLAITIGYAVTGGIPMVFVPMVWSTPIAWSAPCR